MPRVSLAKVRIHPPDLPIVAEPNDWSSVSGVLSRISTALILVVALAFAGCSAYGPPRPGEKVYRDVVFAAPQGHRLHVDLYVPKTSRPAPVVLWIFGGSWKKGYKGYHVNLRDLPQAGIALAAIQYRLSGEATYPAQLEDCEAAVTWLRAHGAKYGLDPNKIGVSGESAGGHLAALLGTVEGAPRVRAVCALYPPTDLVAIGREYASPKRESDIERLLGGPIEQKLAAAKAGSPVDHVSASSPPFLLFHGAQDTLVPVEQSRELDRQLHAAGVESRLVLVPGKGHWFLLTKAQVAEVAQFFHRHFGE
jgi:acetyl esterase/lipase